MVTTDDGPKRKIHYNALNWVSKEEERDWFVISTRFVIRVVCVIRRLLVPSSSSSSSLHRFFLRFVVIFLCFCHINILPFRTLLLSSDFPNHT
ncbi:hypothetical protein VNO77_01725 [Canavalia gladiata]|uniref:Transmembrane protein n=1 Tax=Canavalia gladiata TaxID=3824 RepID=A0AAN9MRR7_CANGL